MTVRFTPKATRSRPYLLNGRRISLSEAARVLNVGLATILRHTKDGRINAAAIGALAPGNPLRKPSRQPSPQVKPARQPRRYEHAGHDLTLSEWADLSGIPAALLHQRVETYGWDMERALTQPVQHQRRRIVTRNRKIIARVVAAFHEARAS